MKKVAKKIVKKVATKVVKFAVRGEKGKAVYLAGDFNEWDPKAKKMAYKARKGAYEVEVKLSRGEHQYKFVIDGTWCTDPENIHAVRNDCGSFNSLIDVK